MQLADRPAAASRPPSAPPPGRTPSRRDRRGSPRRTARSRRRRPRCASSAPRSACRRARAARRGQRSSHPGPSPLRAAGGTCRDSLRAGGTPPPVPEETEPPADRPRGVQRAHARRRPRRCRSWTQADCRRLLGAVRAGPPGLHRRRPAGDRAGVLLPARRRRDDPGRPAAARWSPRCAARSSPSRSAPWTDHPHRLERSRPVGPVAGHHGPTDGRSTRLALTRAGGLGHCYLAVEPGLFRAAPAPARAAGAGRPTEGAGPRP